MNAIILLAIAEPIEEVTLFGYETGTVIALLIFVYLLFSLVKPEKF